MSTDPTTLVSNELRQRLAKIAEALADLAVKGDAEPGNPQYESLLSEQAEIIRQLKGIDRVVVGQ